jgi:hypothetical protein
MLKVPALTGVCGALTRAALAAGSEHSIAGDVTLKTLEETHDIFDSSDRPGRGSGSHSRRGNLQWPEHGRSKWKPLRKHHVEPVASAFLLDEVSALLAYDPGVRSGAQDASRAMMAATGRVCLDLANHRRLLDAATVNRLLAELEWLTVALGPLSHFTPPEGDGYAAAYTTALAALESDRYFRLVADLQLFCSAPPLKTGKSRKHRQSEQMRPMHGPIRSPIC